MEDAADERPAGWVMALPSSMFLVEDADHREEAESAGKKPTKVQESAGRKMALPSSIYLQERNGRCCGRTPSWMGDGSSFLYVLGGRCGSEGGSRKCWKKTNKSAGVRWTEDGTSFLCLLTGKNWKMLRTDAQLDGQWLFFPLCSWWKMRLRGRKQKVLEKKRKVQESTGW